MSKKSVKEQRIKGVWSKVFVTIGGVGSILTILGFLIDKWGWMSDIFQRISDFLQIFLSVFVFVELILLIIWIMMIGTYLKKDQQDIEGQAGSAADRIDEISKAADRINVISKKLEDDCLKCNKNIERFEDIQNKMRLYGIRDIRIRDDYKNDFYKGIYETTKSTLIISGHSLNNTISREKAPDLRPAFQRAVIRVLEGGGSVRVLLQKPVSGDKTSVEKREKVIDFFSELISEILKEKWDHMDTIPERLLVKEVTGLRYFIVRTDTTTLISHYKMAQHNGNKNIYVFDADPNGSFGTCYLDDFHYVFDKEAGFVEEIREQLGKIA